MTATQLPSPLKQRCYAPILAACLLGAGGLARADAGHPFRFPGSDTTFTVGGYVKLDAIWSDRSAGVDSVGDQELNLNAVPVGPTAGQHKKDQVTLHARQSRLSFGTRTPTKYGELKTFIEGDFFGAAGNQTSSNSNGFRTRHAYGTLGKLLAGQTWTNFGDERAFPETVDFGGAAGEIFARQAQVRWTEKTAGGEWSFALENPESVLAVPGQAATFRSDADHAPDLTARLRSGVGRAKYSVSAIAREIGVDSAAAPAATDAKWGGALALTGIVPSGERDDFRFSLQMGNVIGRYQNFGFLPDAYLVASGSLTLARQMGGFAAFRHFWTPALRSTVELSAASADTPDGTAAGVNESDRSVHLNLIWSPIPAVNLGAELIHARRTVVGGDEGRLNRIQFSAQYGF